MNEDKDAEKVERQLPPPHLRIVTPDGEQDMSGYVSVPLEMIPLDVPLPYAVHVRISSKFVKLRAPGDILTHERAHALVKGRVDAVFIQRAEWEQMLHSMENLLAESERAAELTIQQKGENVRSLILGYQREVEIKRNMEKEIYERFKLLAERLSQMVIDHPEVANQLIRRYQDTHLYNINHTINVAIYSVSIGQKRGLPKSTLRLLCLGALLHNIGTIFLPRELMNRTGDLSVKDKLIIDSHVVHGAKLLTRLGAPNEVVLTALQHHDRMDGKNRPSGTNGQLHLFARIVAIADVFDALTSPRPHQPATLTPLAALERMRGMEGKFDPNILNAVGQGK